MIRLTRILPAVVSGMLSVLVFSTETPEASVSDHSFPGVSSIGTGSELFITQAGDPGQRRRVRRRTRRRVKRRQEALSPFAPTLQSGLSQVDPGATYLFQA